MVKAASYVAALMMLCSLASSAADADDASSAWPETVVKIEDLRPLTPFELKIPGVVSKGRVTGPSILKAHVTREGTVSRVILLESCGNPDLDESSIRALRAMRFKPLTFGGTPVEATLALPVHVPARFGRSR
jgi:TonB family protein